MIAALGMYDMAPLQGANDRYWAAIRSALGFGPAQLTRSDDPWDIWDSPDLLFAQTCGLPYRARLHGHAQLVGTPDYGVPGCPPGYYRSVLVARRDDPRQTLHAFSGARFAYNDAFSQSGWAGPITHLRTREITVGPLLETGAHAASARAVAEGRADLAGIDAVTWALLREQSDITTQLTVIDETDPTPGLPYITGARQDPAAIARAVDHAIAALSGPDRIALRLRGLIQLSATAYLNVPTPPAPEKKATSDLRA